MCPHRLGLLTVELADPTGYGRIVRDADGKVAAIVEHKDASDAQRAITEGNTGILAVPADRLADWMSRLSNNNAQGEYYLTDVIEMAVNDGLVVATEQPHDPMEVQGANDRKQLAELERHYQLREGRRLMAQGVTLRDPARFDVRGEVTVGRDVHDRHQRDPRRPRGHRRRRGDRPELRDQGQHPAQRAW